jgi:hypothetical protein
MGQKGKPAVLEAGPGKCRVVLPFLLGVSADGTVGSSHSTPSLPSFRCVPQSLVFVVHGCLFGKGLLPSAPGALEGAGDLILALCLPSSSLLLLLVALPMQISTPISGHSSHYLFSQRVADHLVISAKGSNKSMKMPEELG